MRRDGRIHTLGINRWTRAEFEALAARNDALIADLRIEPFGVAGLEAPDLMRAFGYGRYVGAPHGFDFERNGYVPHILGRLSVATYAETAPGALIVLCACEDWARCVRRDVAERVARVTQWPILHHEGGAAWLRAHNRPIPGYHRIETLTAADTPQNGG